MNEIKIKGEVRSFQTDLKTGKIVPGTDTGWRPNGIDNNFYYYLAQLIASNSTNKALDDLFDDDGTVASVGAAQDGKDGILCWDLLTAYATHILHTTLNAGGAETEAYIEFYGYIDGAVTLSDWLKIGWNYDNSSKGFATTFSGVAVNETVAAGRRYHHYWKFTLS